MSPADLTDLNDLPPLASRAPLADKLARARAVLAAVLAAVLTAGPTVESKEQARGVAVAFTGGKDSSVTLALWREALKGTSAPLLALSVDTGCKFPQVTAFRDALCADWGVALTIARPQVDLVAYPLAQDKLACCRDLKIAPLAKALRETRTHTLLTGLRRDEHPSRAERPYVELRAMAQGNPEHWQVNPILDWTEMDVWAFLTGEALPYCGLYHEGYRSLGCMPCTKPAGADSDERAGRDPEKERQLEILKGLGYF